MPSLSFLARKFGKRTKNKDIVIYKGRKVWIGDPPQDVKWSSARELGGTFDGKVWTVHSGKDDIEKAENLEVVEGLNEEEEE